MGKVRGKNTGPERTVRSLLHRMGFRFRLHRKDLAGKPDIILPKYKTVIFVHGCFWHMCKKCSKGTIPKTRKEFWMEKLRGNVKRDQHNVKDLRDAGWNVITIWECELRDQTEVGNRIERKLKASQLKL